MPRGIHFMKSYFTGKTVLLGGACGAFETELARQLLGAGAGLILTDGATLALARTVRELTSGAADGIRGKILSSFVCDLRAPGGGLAALRTCAKITTDIDIVIIAAGTSWGWATPGTDFEALGARLREEMLAPIQVLALLLRSMTARRAGHLVFISNAPGQLRPARALKKPADTLRREVSTYGISVTLVHRYFQKSCASKRTDDRPADPVGSVENAALRVREARSVLRGLAHGRRNINPGIRAMLDAFAGLPRRVL
jgi:short-subunit dehydrogenase